MARVTSDRGFLLVSTLQIMAGSTNPEAAAAADFIARGERESAEIARRQRANEEKGGEDQEQSQKEQLGAIASKHYLFHDRRDRPFVWMDVEGHREVWPVESTRFRRLLAFELWRTTKSLASSSVITDVIASIAGQALFAGKCHDLGNRVTRWGTSILYDLADEQWRTIEITPSGWGFTISGRPHFRRYAHQLQQVAPSRDGSIERLREFVPVRDEDWPLFVVSLVAALIPDIPRVAPVFYGQQGSGKSVTCRVARALVDPSSIPAPITPGGAGEFAQLLDHHAAVVFDNLREIRPWMSDALCRAITGDGFTKRRLYSDDDDIVYQFRRFVVLNGINIPATAPDLLDRCVLIGLERIPEEDRLDERAYWATLEHAKPEIFGAMLDALSGAMAIERQLSLPRLPRMADWARWGYAISEVLGIGGETFLELYRDNRARQNEEAIAAHPVGEAVTILMRDRSSWNGTPSELMRELDAVAEKSKIDRKAKDWPRSTNWLTRRLNEIRTNLQEAGIAFEAQKSGDRTISLRRDTAHVVHAAQPRPAQDGASDGMGGTDGSPAATDADEPATDRQLKRLRSLADDLGPDTRAHIESIAEDLTARSAFELIGNLGGRIADLGGNSERACPPDFGEHRPAHTQGVV